MMRVARRRPLLVAALLCAATSGGVGAQGATPPVPMQGRLVPTFAWPAMDDSSALVSPLSLQGQVVLIDLWGTWCAPCRREMPFLHDAYSRFHPRGFEILSVSFDVSPGKVAAYRRDHFPMPWLHVYATAAIEAEATRLFRVDNFPRTVPSRSMSTVLRVDTGLRGPALAATLDSLFAGRLTPVR
jgi:thiol-disulfide isomerase/thioredoxin